jgi:hypothetical protein
MMSSNSHGAAVVSTIETVFSHTSTVFNKFNHVAGKRDPINQTSKKKT